MEARGNKLDIPTGYVIESVNDDSIPKEESFTSVPKDVDAEADAVHEVNEITQPLGIPEIGYDAKPQLPNGREYLRPGILNEPVDELLQRGSRTRTKTAKARANYTLADMPMALAKAFAASLATEEQGITIPKTFKESQQLLEAKE